MKECPKCKHVLEDSCDFCPYCGQSLVNVRKTEENKDPSGDSHLKIINSETISGTEIKKKKKEEKETLLTESEAKKVKMINTIDLCLGWALIILPFMFHGLSFGFFWYLLIAGVAFLTLICHVNEMKTTTDKDGTIGFFVIMIIVGIVMFIWGPLNPNYSM